MSGDLYRDERLTETQPRVNAEARNALDAARVPYTNVRCYVRQDATGSLLEIEIETVTSESDRARKAVFGIVPRFQRDGTPKIIVNTNAPDEDNA